MWHLATTAFIRKRAGEKRTEKHIEKSPINHGKFVPKGTPKSTKLKTNRNPENKIRILMFEPLPKTPQDPSKTPKWSPRPSKIAARGFQNLEKSYRKSLKFWLPRGPERSEAERGRSMQMLEKA